MTGAQLVFTPPKATFQQLPLKFVVSPIVGKHTRLPDLRSLINMTLDSEAHYSLQVTSHHEPLRATVGAFSGIYVEVEGYARPAGDLERRLYVLLEDEQFIYGFSYLAESTVFFA